jgi:glycosyltransferase involved in cell wall biosynthesis
MLQDDAISLSLTPGTARAKSVIFGPLPPPLGGVCSIGAWLKEGLSGVSDVAFHPIVNKGGSTDFARSAQNLRRLYHAIRASARGGTVLMFASSGASFFEKCLWATVCASMSRQAKIMMVDGNFPAFWEGLGRSVRWAVRGVLRSASVSIVVQSDTWKSWYRREFPGQKLEAVGATADDGFFQVGRNRVAGGAKPVLLLYVGWVIRGKGVQDLLAAVAQAKAKVSGFHLDIVGPIHEDCDFWPREIERLGLERHVSLHGPIVDRAALLKAYARADIFTFPSHAEGFPVALLEAAASGLACVSTSVGGTPDILAHGRAGLLVDPERPDQLADHIVRLVRDPREIAVLGCAAHQWAVEQFSGSRCMDSYRRVLELDRTS